MSQVYPILINLFAAIIGALGQYMYKIGALRLKEVPIYMNWQLLSGVILFTSVMFLFILSFRLGGKLSVVYPMYATTFIWGAIIGIFIDNEPWNGIQTIGLLLVVLGLFIIAKFSLT